MFRCTSVHCFSFVHQLDLYFRIPILVTASTFLAQYFFFVSHYQQQAGF